MHQSLDDDASQIELLRRLYWTTIICFWAGLPFLLSHGICAHLVLPALGIIPMTVSQVTSIYRLIKLRKKGDHEYQIILGEGEHRNVEKEHFTGLLATLDIAIVLFEFLVFVFTCVVTYGFVSYSGFQALAAYATVFLLVDMVIHGYLVVKYIANSSWKIKRHDCSTNCPNCRAASEAAGAPTNRYRDMAEATPEEEDTSAGSASGA